MLRGHGRLPQLNSTERSTELLDGYCLAAPVDHPIAIGAEDADVLDLRRRSGVVAFPERVQVVALDVLVPELPLHLLENESAGLACIAAKRLRRLD